MADRRRHGLPWGDDDLRLRGPAAAAASHHLQHVAGRLHHRGHPDQLDAAHGGHDGERGGAEKGFDGLSRFVSWSDGPTSRTLQITVGPADLSLGAVYRTPIDTRYASDAAFRTKMGDPTGAEQGDLAVRSRTFAGGVAYWSSAAGVHFVAGSIARAYAALGGPAWCGVPTTDELRTNPVGGYYNHFTRSCSIFWGSGAGAHSVNGAIRTLWGSLGWEKSLLGYPTTNFAATPARPGAYNRFQKGAIYYSASTGARYLTGAIASRYLALRAEASALRFPTTHTRATATGGRYQHFQGGSMFWSSSTGAHPVTGAILSTWAKLGYERSWLGYPKSDAYTVTVGIRQNFQRGYLVWNRSTGTVKAYRT